MPTIARLGNPPRRDDLNATRPQPFRRAPSTASPHTTASARSPASLTFPKPIPQPLWRLTPPPLRCNSGTSEFPAPYSPPPQMTNDYPRYGLRGGVGTPREKVHTDHDVREVRDGDGEEAHDAGLSAWGCKCGGNIGEASEEGVQEEDGFERACRKLDYIQYLRMRLESKSTHNDRPRGDE